MKKFRLSALAIMTGVALTGAAVAEDFPREGYADASNGLAAPLAGNWSLGFPRPEGTIVAETIISCDDPVVIAALDETNVSFKTPAMPEALPFELSAFRQRTSWFPADNSPTMITVWLTPDSFHLYVTDMGKANWDDPRLMERCPAS